jgi:hypothetical protein
MIGGFGNMDVMNQPLFNNMANMNQMQVMNAAGLFG